MSEHPLISTIMSDGSFAIGNGNQASTAREMWWEAGVDDITNYLLIVVVSESLLSITGLDARLALGPSPGMARTKMA
jgi:hypothetical protein